MRSRFKYYNHNPDNNTIEDCVCRAISTAIGLCYDAVNNLLTLIAKEYGCDKLCVCCYSNLLEDVLCYERHSCRFRKTVAEVAAEHSKNKVIIRVDQHLTVAVYGNVLDIWDCSDEPVDCYWIV